MNATLSQRDPRQCRACDNIRGNKTVGKHFDVYECARCKAIFGTCYLGESYVMVKPWMTSENVPPENQRYYDFTTIGSDGIGRRHGWYDVNSGLITQVG